ncbi:MAG: T9SS type A sorting domain-containing protein [Bacteroidales bacterium]|nr:T9SS type A sorting domain-containing protein [Bacteroidales bacterium]
MKKLYLILLTVILGGTLSYFYFLGSDSNRSFLGKNYISEDVREESKEAGKADEYSKYFNAITTKFNKKKSNYPFNYRISEFDKAVAKAKTKGKFTKASTITWTQRGPANVGGRTRGLIIDPDDATNNTWFAGSVAGGIWKTTDGGSNWTCLTDDFPNLFTVSLAMAESNHQVLYAGTGEFNGAFENPQGCGMFKSTDKGANWIQLTSTSTDDFKYVNRIVVDPSNADIVIAVTGTGIQKSINGGTSWTEVYSSTTGVEDIDADPTDFNKLYATEYAVGVVLSTDAGDNWNRSIDGLEQGTRYELAISQENPAKIYLSINSATPMAYRSIDYGATWQKFVIDGTIPDLLGQGDYDNIIAVHPYEEDVAFIAGVNMYKADYSSPGTTADSDPSIYRIDLEDIDSYMSFIPFGGAYLNGGMELGTANEATNLTEDDFVAVEIRFGSGMSQKAHRFTVGGEGSGVAPSGYIYEDYVDVPFEVWDITNNKQLMASFRDQAENSIFDLVARIEADPAVGREYLFVNAVDYSETASSEIAKDAGHSYKQLYFFWPTLAEGGTWDAANLPESKISIKYGTITEITGTLTTVAHWSNGPNSYSQGAGMGTTSIPGLHPDHHNLIMIKTDEANEKFIVINANDGGLAISEDEAVTFNQLPNNYITTQFYGVAKRPGANEYIGGMQDNGTWATPDGENSSSNTDFIFHIGGDGFECVWNTNDADKLIGSVYENNFRKSTNGGDSWTSSTNGIATVNPFDGDSQLDGPFLSRISYNKNAPDVLFAVGYNGIYKSTNFATNWNKIIIDDGWNSEYWTESEYVSSQHNVEVSLANENIVWAGAAMNEGNGWKINVSTDQGETFSAVAEYSGGDLSGFISGIATHPTEDSTAYILFSFAEETKVIRTKDLGQTWEDISGFNGNTTSSNGFPDVVTHCLVVMPHDPSTIWVGTDIGIFESTDDGANWNYLISDLPAVSIWDMFVQDGQVVIATHGRGIWSATIEELGYFPTLNTEYAGFQNIDVNVELINAVDSVLIYMNDDLVGTEKTVIAGVNEFQIPVTTEGTFTINVESYKSGEVYNSSNKSVTVDFSPVIALANINDQNSVTISSDFTEEYDSIQVFVKDVYDSSVEDPASGAFSTTVDLPESGTYDVFVNAYIGDVAYKSNTESISFTFVGINLNKAKSLNVYPNPTQGNVNIELPDNFNGNYTIDVYSLSGSKVYSKLVNKNDNQVNLESLNNGMYIIRLENDGNVYSQKIKVRK